MDLETLKGYSETNPIFQGQSELFQQAIFLIYTTEKQIAWRANLIALEDKINLF